jgi:HSP20 family molecular chaperone IbpA
MFGGGPFFSPGRDIDTLIGTEAWQPECNVRETEEGLFIEASLPGVRREDIDLQLFDRDLVLSGERKEEKSSKEEGYWTRERSYGKFRRSIRLPPGVQANQIRTGFHNGLLQVLVSLPLEGRRQMGGGEFARRPEMKEEEGGYQEWGSGGQLEPAGSRSPTIPRREEGGPIQEEGTREETKPLLETQETKPLLERKEEKLQEQRSVFIGREATPTGSTNV